MIKKLWKLNIFLFAFTIGVFATLHLAPSPLPATCHNGDVVAFGQNRVFVCLGENAWWPVETVPK